MRSAVPSSEYDPRNHQESSPPRWLAWAVVVWIIICGTAYAQATLAARFPALAARLFGR